MEALSRIFVKVGKDLYALWPILVAIGGALGVFAACVKIATPFLQQDESFEQIRNWARNQGLAARYRALIRSGLGAANRFYGDAPGLSWRGYQACLVVALIYPFFLWQLAWVLGGPATIGGLPGFDETMSSGRRWVMLALLWAAIFVFAVFLRNLDSLNNRFSRALLRLRDNSRLLGFIPQSWVRAVGMSVAVGAGIGVVAGVTVGAVGAGVMGDAGVASVYVTMLILIPAANAVLARLIHDGPWMGWRM